MQAENPLVEDEIQRALANESLTELRIGFYDRDPPPLTVIDSRRIIACLRYNPRFHTLSIHRYDIHDNAAVLNVFLNGLPLCTAVTAVHISGTLFGNEDLDRLRRAFYNTSITRLHLTNTNIQGQRGGNVLRDLLVGNNTLADLSLGGNRILRDCARGLGRGLADCNNRLQTLCLNGCNIGNDGLAHLLLSMGDETCNNSLTDLVLCFNCIQGAEGGRQVGLLLLRFQRLKVLRLEGNHLGPLGAIALAPSLTLPNLVLEALHLAFCQLHNDGLANLIPAGGQVNRSLKNLFLSGNNIGGTVGGENAIALAAHFTNLDRIDVAHNSLNPDQLHCLDLLLDRKSLYTEAQALGGSPSSVVFQKLVQANSHEHGLSASFVILRDCIFAEQHKASSGEQNVQKAATGVKRKR